VNFGTMATARARGFLICWRRFIWDFGRL